MGDAIAPYAYSMLERAMGANDAGEVPGIGSEWSCKDFGRPGHNYTVCKTCLDNLGIRNKSLTSKNLLN